MKLGILVFLSILCVSCRSTRTFFTADELVRHSNSVDLRDIESYNEISFTITLQLAFHFINVSPDTGMFSINEGEDFVRVLINSANERWSKNHKMNLPAGNRTQVNSIGLQLQTIEGGIQTHLEKSPAYFRKQGRNINLYDDELIKKYSINKDSVINVFILAFDPEELRSGGQRIERTGVSLGKAIKLAGIYESDLPAWEFSALLNHEIGHVLGLSHSWNTNDGCDDTPLHANCWNTMDRPPCLAPTSNNLMDYNAHQSALTPCQINKIRSFLLNTKTGNALIKKRIITEWDNPIRISENSRVDGLNKVDQDIEIIEDTQMIISGEIHLSSGVQIKLHKGSRLIFKDAKVILDHNWNGLFMHRKARLGLENSQIFYSKVQ